MKQNVRLATILATAMLSVALLPLPAFAFSAKTGTTDQFKLELKSVPEKLAVNQDTTYELKILDKNNNEPVKSANLKLSATMDQAGGHNMPGMESQSSGSQIESDFTSTGKAGQFQSKIAFNMEGDWQLRVTGTADGKPVDFGLNDSVVQPTTKPNWVVIGGFLALIVGTGTIFANKKRTKASDGQNRMYPTDIPAEDEA